MKADANARREIEVILDGLNSVEDTEPDVTASRSSVVTRSVESRLDKQRLAAARCENIALRAALSDADAPCALLKANRDAAIKQLAVAQQELADVSGRVIELQAQLAKTNTENAGLRRALSINMDHADAVQRELDRCREHTASLAAELKLRDCRVAEGDRLLHQVYASRSCALANWLRRWLYAPAFGSKRA